MIIGKTVPKNGRMMNITNNYNRRDAIYRVYIDTNNNMMLYKNRYRIESNRLKNWDYDSSGFYFITICTKDRVTHFGKIKNGGMVKTRIGTISEKFWSEIPNRFSNAKLDKFIIMPNHIHGILIINNNNHNKTKTVETRFIASPNKKNIITTPNHIGGITGKNNPMFYQSISRIIRWYKGRCTFEINKNTTNISFFWQPGFYDHIIRNDKKLNEIRKYIKNNPKKWQDDEYYK